MLAAPPGTESLPSFDGGWVTGSDVRAAFLSYTDMPATNWSDELELLHEEATRTHFLDVWTREAIVRRVGRLRPGATLVDLGCSAGYLLERLRDDHPEVTLVGVDLVAAGLVKAHERVSSARLIQADVCALPLASGCADIVVSANLLEHVPDDSAALAELLRVLAPSGRAVIVVPAGPGTYDYYDRFLGHERRYGRGELACKARAVGFEVVEDGYLASLIYPAFWVVKRRNRRRYDDLRDEALKRRVAANISATSDSRIGRFLRSAEETLRLRLPFGVRGIVVLRRDEL